MSFPHEIKDRLVAQGVGIYGTNIFIGKGSTLPPKGFVGAYLLIVETGGSGPDRVHNPGGALERPSAMISCGADSGPTARTMLAAALAAFGGADGLYNISLGTAPGTVTFYLSLTIRTAITDIGADGAGRPMYGFNVDAEKKPS